MGSGQSVRSTHFSRQPTRRWEPDGDEHHISISNKMVERLVEDATIAGGAAAATKLPPKPRSDYKDKIFTEKIRCLDESHSEKYKITVHDLKALTHRIEMRTANMATVEPVCEDWSQRVIDCYNKKDAESSKDVVKCWDTIGAFSKCVQDAAATRLRARTLKEAREHARRERHVAHAREQAVLLGPAPDI